MKKIFYFLFITLFLFSCGEEPQGDSDNVTLYYYGRSHSGTTYEVPLKFYSGGKEIAFFVLYSLSPDLESGIYTYNDSFYYNCQTFNDFVFTDKTFYKKVCKWNNNEITGGTVTVEKTDDKYNFIIDVTDYNGENHKGSFKGKVKKENYHQQSKVNGFFARADIDNFLDDHIQVPEDFTGGITWVTLTTGDKLYGMTVDIIYIHPNPNDFTGVYEVNPNANGSFNADYSAIQNLYFDKIGYQGNKSKLVSGTFTVTQVDKPWKFKIDVDVVAKNGDIIQGRFDGGEIWFSDYDYQNYTDHNYADYYR